MYIHKYIHIHIYVYVYIYLYTWSKHSEIHCMAAMVRDSFFKQEPVWSMAWVGRKGSTSDEITCSVNGMGTLKLWVYAMKYTYTCIYVHMYKYMYV